MSAFQDSKGFDCQRRNLQTAPDLGKNGRCGKISNVLQLTLSVLQILHHCCVHQKCRNVSCVLFVRKKASYTFGQGFVVQPMIVSLFPEHFMHVIAADSESTALSLAIEDRA